MKCGVVEEVVDMDMGNEERVRLKIKRALSGAVAWAWMNTGVRSAVLTCWISRSSELLFVLITSFSI